MDSSKKFKDNYKYNVKKVLQIIEENRINQVKQKKEESIKQEKENINQAFSEVYDIINHFEKRIYNKIPTRFIEMIKANKDNSYQPQIDYSISINKQKLLKETRIILSLIYRDYICSNEKREELKYNDMIEIKEYQEKIYNPDNLFKKKSYRTM